MQLMPELPSFLATIQSSGGDARDLRIDLPDNEEVCQIEAEIGLAIPAELRHMMLQVSSPVESRWFLKDSFESPLELGGVF
jgi:hypothetical protein